MKKLFTVLITVFLSLVITSCGGEPVDVEESTLEENTTTEYELPVLDNMAQLSSYKAVITTTNSLIEVDKTETLLFKDNVSYWYYTDFPYIYKNIDGEDKMLLWMETEYYSFDIPELDMIHLFDFTSYADKGVRKVNDNRYAVEDYPGLNMFVMHVTNDLINEIEFNYQIVSGETMSVSIEFSEYDSVDVSYTGTPELPGERQNYLYSFYESGYNLKITDADLRLYGVNYTVKISRGDDYIRLFVSDWYYEINPETKEIAVVTKSSHVNYSYNDFFRINKDYNFTKEEVDSYIELYDIYLSIY